MLKSPPREKQWLSWLYVVSWTLIIFVTIPLARRIQKYVAEEWSRDIFTYFVLATAVLGFLAAAMFVRRHRPATRSSYVWLITSFFNASKGATYAAQPNRVVVNNREVLSTFKDHNLILVLQGHLHVSELIEWQNTTFVTGGAVCGKWWRGVWYGTEEGFYDIRLTGNRVECSYIDYGWVARRPPNK